MEVFVLLSVLSLIAGEYDYGYRVDNQLLKLFNDTGERSCCKECIAYTNCQSVNYNKNNYSCELNYQHISGPGKAIHAEYVYMDRSHCFSLASCSKRFCNLSCNANEKCVLTSMNQPACIITECDPTATILDISPEHVRREVGLSHWLWCTVPPTDSIQLFTCDTDGQWVKNYSSCVCWYGTYLDGNVCKKCQEGKYLPYYNKKGSSSCIDCPAGYYTPVPGLGKCTACPIGSYQSSHGKSFCDICQAGKYSNVEAATFCVDCLEGHYQPDPGQGNCIACPIGSYQSSHGKSFCDICQAGSYSDVEAATSCLDCPKGHFQPESGQDNCIACPIGSYQSSHGKSSCDICQAGSYSDVEAATSCLDCPKGHFQPESGQSNCIPCPIGFCQDTIGETKCDPC
ncbi:multiple epidermal growth factor-like domains protein 9 [Crassostrea angulata]|uniref:multiple epidermal growth factor-like domains protein 9 n=1 Tax=Magallana angulata TaxID=2784310 RepID=UPI0022B14E9F|nr:multiple epidermal growth factor-like domains protein 9 [Crassostrea angulata]